MAALAGYGGTAKVGGALIAEVTDWNLDVQVNILDTTIMADAWKDQIGGIKSWSGKITCNWYMTDAQQTTIQNAILTGTSSVALALSVNGGTNSYSGSAWIKQFSIKDAAQAVVTFDLTFDGTGAITYA